MAACTSVRIVLYRHGQTEHNLTGVISGGSSKAIPLTPTGEIQAKKVGELLKSHFPVRHGNYCSDLERAKRTAELALSGEFVTTLEELREIDHGANDGILKASERNKIWQDFIVKEVAQWKKENQPVDPFFKWKHVPPALKEAKAETFMELGHRVTDKILEVAERHKVLGEETVVTIGSHNAVIYRLFMQSVIASGLGKEYGIEQDSDGLYPMFFEKSLLENGTIAEFKVDYPVNEANPIQFVRFINPPKDK